MGILIKVVLFFVIFSGTAFAQLDFSQVNCGDADATTWCCNTTCTAAAFTTAYGSGTGNRTIYIPSGDFDWTTGTTTPAVYITNMTSEVSIIGQGTSSTILRMAGGSASSPFFRINTATAGGPTPYFRISGIKFINGENCTDLVTCRPRQAIQFYRTQNFRIDHNEFWGYWDAVINWKMLSKGLIDNNIFINPMGTGSYTYIAGNYYGPSAGMPSGGSPNDCYPPSVTCTGPNSAGTYMPYCRTTECVCTVGEATINRASSVASGKTAISSVAAAINLKASGTGLVRRVYFYIATANEGATVTISSFSKSGTTFTARARAVGLSAKVGLNSFSVDNADFTAFAINHGDYLGVYLDGATLEVATGATGYSITGDKTTPEASTDFGAANVGAVSLWADLFDDSGYMAACETIWNNWFNDTTRGGGYYQGWDSTWNYDVNAIYFEDNIFNPWYKSFTSENWGSHGRQIYRYNTFKEGPLAGGGLLISFAKPGGLYSIWHNNIFQYNGTSPSGYALWTEVNGLVYNNKYTNLSTVGTYRGTDIYSGNYYFPWKERQLELYIWNNTLDGLGCGATESGCWNYAETTGIYFTSGPGENGTLHFRAPIAGERLYDNTSCLASKSSTSVYGITTPSADCAINEYVYPHGLRSGDTADTTPPVRSTPLPTGTVNCPASPISTTLSILTNEPAICKYGASIAPDSSTSATSYDDLPNTFESDTSNKTTHTQSLTGVTGLPCDATYTYYVRCMDGALNKNTDTPAGGTITFTVQAPVSTEPVISGHGPQTVQTCSANPKTVALVATTDVNATCRYGWVGSEYDLSGSLVSVNTVYSNLPHAFTTTGTTSHAQNVSHVCGNGYVYVMRCENAAGYRNSASSTISFPISSSTRIKGGGAPFKSGGAAFK